jgi:hypothetical protein
MRSTNMQSGIAFMAFAIIATLSIALSSFALAKPKVAAAPQEEVQWDWWYVWAGGETPSREIHYIDALSVQTRVDNEAVLSGNFDPRNPASFVEADGVAVFEDAKNKPARINGRVRVKCDKMQMMFLQSYKQYWKADRFEKVHPTQWFDANSDLKFRKIAHFLCKPKERNAKNQMMRVYQKEDPLDFTWDVAWSALPKPKFTTSKTLAQSQADFDKQVARSEAIIKDGTKKAEEQRAQILRDERVTAVEQRALFSKMRSKASPLLHSWLGAQESALVATWGVPNSSHNTTNARFLSYVYGFERQYQTQDGNGNVVASSRDEFSCNMTFEVRDGIIKDYRSDGNYCGSAASSLARGPN